MKESLIENKRQLDILYLETCHVKNQLKNISNFIQTQQLAARIN